MSGAVPAIESGYSGGIKSQSIHIAAEVTFAEALVFGQ